MKSELVNIKMQPEEVKALRQLASDMSFEAGKNITSASVIRFALKKLSEVYYGKGNS